MNIADEMRARSISALDTDTLWRKTLDEIEKAAERGGRDLLVCYTDCLDNPENQWILAEAKRQGFTVERRVEYSNGIRQFPSMHICW